MIVWLLTLYLNGIPIYQDLSGWPTYRKCMDEGWSLARKYQEGQVKVIPDCQPEAR